MQKLIFTLLIFNGFTAPSFARATTEAERAAYDQRAQQQYNAVTEILKGQSDETIIYSIDPTNFKDGEKFHYRKIVGSAKLANDQKAAAQKAFLKSFRPYTREDGVMMCFNPRQGLRMKVGKDIYDFSICFSCQNIYVYKNNEDFGEFKVTGRSEQVEGILRANGVPVVKAKND